MGSTAKALKLLDYFSASRPSIGLTQFAKLSGYDKATTHRRLSDLCAAGFVEQEIETRAYRLGPAVLRLANVRESTFPRRESAMPALQALSNTMGETVHLSLIEGNSGLATLIILESSKHSMRVHIDDSEVLPFHATASGLACLAFSSDQFQQQVLSQDLKPSTAKTLTDKKLIQSQILETLTSGFGCFDGSYEPDVTGISAPVFGTLGACIGAVAVATPSSRITPTSKVQTYAALKKAAIAITTAWGGELPEQLKHTWSLAQTAD